MRKASKLFRTWSVTSRVIGNPGGNAQETREVSAVALAVMPNGHLPIMPGLNRRSYNGGGPCFCDFFYQRRLDKITLVE